MERETGKQRSQRIEIDYYRKRTDLSVWRFVCIGIGVIGAGAYAAYVLASGSGAQVSTGPVAESHAAFENDCKQCHQDFTPIDADAVETEWSLIGLSKAESVKHTEAACQSCHRVGDHHRASMTDAWKFKDQNCASCHADHQGRQFDLTAVSASKCIDCHANLADGCTGKPTVREQLTGFTEESHGLFASLTTGDPGKVKFDHVQHMLPGQVDRGSKGAFTLSMMTESNRSNYRVDGQTDDDPVQLNCASCHEMAGNPDLADGLIADAELGRYIKPISFEDHCSACHALNPGMATADATPLPHAAPWSQIDLLLKGTLAGARASEQSRALRDDLNTTPVPGEGLGRPSVTRSLYDPGELEQARLRVEANCEKCHEPEHFTDAYIAKAAAGLTEPLIPPRWLSKGLYDHAAHRQIDCAYCHASAYPSEQTAAGPANDHETVMIENIASCVGCHRDAETPTPDALLESSVASLLGGMSTWSSDNCTVCHRYHTRLSVKGGANP